MARGGCILLIRSTWASFQYTDHLFRYGDFHYQDKKSYFYNRNLFTGNMILLYWDGPLALTALVKDLMKSQSCTIATRHLVCNSILWQDMLWHLVEKWDPRQKWGNRACCPGGHALHIDRLVLTHWNYVFLALTHWYEDHQIAISLRATDLQMRRSDLTRLRGFQESSLSNEHQAAQPSIYHSKWRSLCYLAGHGVVQCCPSIRPAGPTDGSV